MTIFIDIGHPAHVHYFKNLINELSQGIHHFVVTARDREIIKSLLNFYKISYINRGKGKDSLMGKLGYMCYADILLLKEAIKFDPDIFLSFSSPYAAQVSKIMRKPHIALNDTEHADKAHKIFTYPFSDAILTPHSYQNDLGTKHFKIKSLIEYFYLQSSYFTPDENIYKLLGIDQSKKYAIVRFISWKAFHDVNQGGLSLNQKKELINILENKYRVFITSEAELEPEFQKYQIKIPPERMHDALAFSSLFVGESGTMASESALLGVPVVYINSLPLMCYLKEEQNYGLLKHFKNGNGVLDYISSLIAQESLKQRMIKKRNQMVKNFINPTNFLMWFIENWPKSKSIMQETPEYQDQFK